MSDTFQYTRETDTHDGSLGKRFEQCASNTKNIITRTSARARTMALELRDHEYVQAGLQAAREVLTTEQLYTPIAEIAGTLASYSPTATELLINWREQRLAMAKRGMTADKRPQAIAEHAKKIIPRRIDQLRLQNSHAAIDAVTNPAIDKMERTITLASAFIPALISIARMIEIAEDTTFRINQQKQTAAPSTPMMA